MPHCQGFRCSNHTEKNKKSFFQIPNPETHAELCKKWLNAISVKKFDFKSFKSSRFNVVCEEHFTEDCFTQRLSKRKSRLRLKNPVYADESVIRN
ncbi:THAP domain-containing protein 1 [Holothuria leucospilota]|uniref:THAP domain-containing protein 1 n=1 Tax=Holothuria leucospilota TaxID=206669 RepID=A0A9Q1CU83_HOLLE|nr:THAP domain-containing protein 1 [Holothuria leucospilota]